MQTYRYAYDASGCQVDALELVPVPGAVYYCFACGAALIAKVGGTKVDRHFAHKVKGKCGGETYLHIIAKNLFKARFDECKRETWPMWVEIPRVNICPNAARLMALPCHHLALSSSSLHDLMRTYTHCTLEKKDGRFIPDLLLFNPATSQKMYVEIKHKSPCSADKLASGVRILEIGVSHEYQLAAIASWPCFRNEQEEEAFYTAEGHIDLSCAFYNFPPRCLQDAPFGCCYTESQRRLHLQKALSSPEFASRIVSAPLPVVSQLAPEPALELKPMHSVDSVINEFKSRYGLASSDSIASFLAGRHLSTVPLSGPVFDVPSSFVDEVIAVFGGRLLDEDEP